MAYAFDATAADGTLRFIQRGGAPVAEIVEDDLVLPDSGAVARLTRAQETELPHEASFGFTDGVADYRRSAVTSRKLVGGRSAPCIPSLPSSPTRPRPRAARKSGCRIYGPDARVRNFRSASIGCGLAPGDVIALTIDDRRRLFEIDDFVDTERGRQGAQHRSRSVFRALAGAAHESAGDSGRARAGCVTVLDLPTIDSSQPVVLTRLAISANPWPGSVAVWKSSDGSSFEIAAWFRRLRSARRSMRCLRGRRRDGTAPTRCACEFTAAR